MAGQSKNQSYFWVQGTKLDICVDAHFELDPVKYIGQTTSAISGRACSVFLDYL